MTQDKNIQRLARKIALISGAKSASSLDQELKRMKDKTDVPDKKVNKNDIIPGKPSDVSGPKRSKDKEVSDLTPSSKDPKVKKEKALKELQKVMNEYAEGKGSVNKVKYHRDVAEKAGVPAETLKSLFKKAGLLKESGNEW